MKRLMIVLALPLAGCFTESAENASPGAAPEPVRYVVQTDTKEQRYADAMRIFDEIRADPTRILRIDFAYPPAEERAKFAHNAAAFSAEWHAVSMLPGSGVKVDEATLVAFLEKTNWKEALPMITGLWTMNVLGPEARRRLAPRVESVLTCTENLPLRCFYCHKNTPDDVIERAIAHPQANDALREQLRDYLNGRKTP